MRKRYLVLSLIIAVITSYFSAHSTPIKHVNLHGILKNFSSYLKK
ncbi:hypothetical protein JOD45_003305 [Scopulibacillus daqui]|uniref:Uncharacterized protein n=1 Tax=Scopulibacillus daqui TaxID=1469162 RepID=A0ABS2Q445_9BACL|nr:hypothetical protein [Scopulibacillus daqui]